MKILLTIWALIGAQSYLDMRNHSYREMVEYMKLIKYTCPGEFNLFGFVRYSKPRNSVLYFRRTVILSVHHLLILVKVLDV